MIDIEKFICSLLADHPVGITVREDIHKALKEQGLEYKDGKIAPIEDKTELKESEDEKIRKTLMKFFVDWGKSRSHFWSISIPKVLIWLNKQGEKGTNGNEREIPNSSWSEKDEVELINIINFFDSSSTAKLCPTRHNEAIAWLKSLKDRIQPQPNQEWCEEDENEYNHTLKILNLVAEEQETKGYNNLISSVNWLKSLKDRYTWKPSAEQMEVLNWCKPLWNEPKTKAVLETLIEDLKELKG